MNNNCKGIVLRQSEYRDNDMILSVFSEEKGKISFYARGLKKPTSKNAASCNLFCLSKFYYEEKNNKMKLLKNAERIKMFRHIYEDLLSQTCAQCICECVEKIEDEQKEEIFHLLSLSLEYLDEKKDPILVLSLFLAQVCKLLGIMPNVNECIKCKKKNQIASISLTEGGFLCIDCMDFMVHKRFKEATLRLFRLLFKGNMNDLNTIEQYYNMDEELVNLLFSFLEEYSGITLKSKMFLDKIISIK